MAPPLASLARQDPFGHAEIPEATVRFMTPRFERQAWAPDLTEPASRLTAHSTPPGVRVSEQTNVGV